MTRYLLAKDRPGRSAWLGPAALGLGLICWVFPVVGIIIALGAVACGVVSMTTQTQYRMDWTAIAGTILGSAHVVVALILLLVELRGH